MKLQFIENLTTATPARNVFQWIILTLLYGVAIIVNDHFELIISLGITQRYEAIIRLCGVYLYIILTTYQFQKTKRNENSIDDYKIPPTMAGDDQLHGIASAEGTPGSEPGDRAN